MPRFFFDHRDGDLFLQDDEGLEFATLEAARTEAKAALGGIAKDALAEEGDRELAIEVSDENRKPLFRTALWLKVQPMSDALIPN